MEMMERKYAEKNSGLIYHRLTERNTVPHSKALEEEGQKVRDNRRLQVREQPVPVSSSKYWRHGLRQQSLVSQHAER